MPTIDNIEFGLQAFLICDSCVRDVQSGKTSVQGIFDVLYARSFPCVHPQATLYFRITFDRAPNDPIEVSFRTTGPTGIRNTSPATPLSLPANSERAEGFIIMQGFQFSQAGRYSFELLVNGQAIGEYTLTAQLVGQPSGSRLLN